MHRRRRDKINCRHRTETVYMTGTRFRFHLGCVRYLLWWKLWSSIITYSSMRWNIASSCVMAVKAIRYETCWKCNRSNDASMVLVRIVLLHGMWWSKQRQDVITGSRRVVPCFGVIASLDGWVGPVIKCNPESLVRRAERMQSHNNKWSDSSARHTTMKDTTRIFLHHIYRKPVLRNG